MTTTWKWMNIKSEKQWHNDESWWDKERKKKTDENQSWKWKKYMNIHGKLLKYAEPWLQTSACMYACMHASMYVCVYECMYACMYVCMQACMHVCMYTCMHVCVNECMLACLHVCMYVCMNVCMLEMLKGRKTEQMVYQKVLNVHCQY